MMEAMRIPSNALRAELHRRAGSFELAQRSARGFGQEGVYS